jgi:hypothetical protein
MSNLFPPSREPLLFSDDGFRANKYLFKYVQGVFSLNIPKIISQPTKSAHRAEPSDLEGPALPDF